MKHRLLSGLLAVVLVLGLAPGALAAPPAEDGPKDALDDLLAFGAQFDNIKIQ